MPPPGRGYARVVVALLPVLFVYPFIGGSSLLADGMFPGQLRLQLGDLVPQLEDPADGDEAHALADELDGVLEVVDLMAGVAALTAGRACRPYHVMFVETAKESLLDVEHLGHLANRVQRSVLVVERQPDHQRSFPDI
jgi:hypothetical protein